MPTRNLAMRPFRSSFLNVEKDTNTIIKKLFVESKPYSDVLKRLLVIPSADCLDNTENEVYKEAVAKATPAWLKKNNFIVTVPRVPLKEFEEKKSYILISFDNFTETATNPEYRDCVIAIDVISHIDIWDLGNYRLRPLRIAGYIDGILNNNRLSGIGLLQFLGCTMIHLNENLSGYTLLYQAVHGIDDKIPEVDDVKPQKWENIPRDR